MRKDKKQVIGEAMSDEAICRFLHVEPSDDTPPSLHKLMLAYYSLRIDDFIRFLAFFKANQFELNSTDQTGANFVDLIKDQHKAQPYIEAFENTLNT